MAGCGGLTRINSTMRLGQFPLAHIILIRDLGKPRASPPFALPKLRPQLPGLVGLTRIARTTRLGPPCLPQLLIQFLPTRTVLILDIRKPRASPRFALPEILPQFHGGVRLSRIARTTRLRPARLPQLLLQILPTHTVLGPDLRKPRLAPFHSPSELFRQCLGRVGLTRVVRTTELLAPCLPHLLIQILPTRAGLILDLPEPGMAPPFALPELRPQRRAGVRLTRITSTTRLLPRLLPQLIRIRRDALAFVTLDLPKPLQTPPIALPELRPQRRAGVRLTRITSTTRLLPRLLPHHLRSL